MSDFSIDDYTVITEWEAFTAEIESFLKKWERGTNSSFQLDFKGYPVNLDVICDFPTNPLLCGLSSLNTLESPRQPHAYISRAFNVGSFAVIGSSEAVFSLATARLLLSSSIIAGLASSLPVFVEYEGGELLGVSRDKKFFLHSRDDVEGNDQQCQSLAIRKLLLEYFPDTPRKDLEASYDIVLFSKPDCRYKVEENENWELDLGLPCSTIDCLQLETIFPQIDPGRLLAGLPPLPFEAPIWILTAQKLLSENLAQPRLCTLLNGLVEILSHSSEPIGHASHELNDQTRICALSDPTFKVSNEWIDETFDAASLHGIGIPDKIIIAFLNIFSNQCYNHAPVSWILKSHQFANSWMGVCAALRKRWNSLEELKDISPGDTANGQDALTQQLETLNLCIACEKKYLWIPGVPVRALNKDVGGILDALASKHQANVGERRKQQIDTIRTRVGKFGILLRRPPSLTKDIPRSSAAVGSDGEDIEADVFFDATEDIPTVEEAGAIETLKALHLMEKNVVTSEPEGRKAMLGDLPISLIGDETEVVWVPYTQEDFVREVDPDQQAHALFQKRKTAQLVSDMQAFKAANPKACFQDFVRWHSPRDLSLEGALSPRMSLPGNLWSELWKACHALPVSRQPLLFDHRREAEKVLSSLENATVKEIFEMIIPLALKVISDQVAHRSDKEMVLKIPQVVDQDTLDAFLASLQTAEYLITLKRELGAVLPDCIPVDQLIKGEPILIAQEEHRQAVSALFEGRPHGKPGVEVMISSLATQLYIKFAEARVEVGVVQPSEQCAWPEHY